LTIVANGAGSTFTKKLNTAEPKVMSYFVGLELQDAAKDLPFVDHGNVFITKNGPVLCYPTSSTTVRCLIDFPVNDLPNIGTGEMAKRLKEVYAPQLPECIRRHFIEAVESGRIRSAHNREMAAEPMLKSGAILLGDAFNCRHPLTGGGMTVGLSDCVIIRDLLTDVNLYDIEEVDRALSKFYMERKKISSTINILANALYAIFAARKDPIIDYMKQAVFEYFKRGGNCVAGPVGLLGGLIESPYVLLMHFFSVAIYFCVGQLFPCPTPKSLYVSARLMKAATLIVAPLISDENILAYLFPPLVMSARK
jgi:squalene monooxygenase